MRGESSKIGGPLADERFDPLGELVLDLEVPCLWVPKLGFPANQFIRRRRIGVLALARSGLRQTDALIEACSSDSSAA
jgi:hypothetical protein